MRVQRARARAQVTVDRLVTSLASTHDENLPPAGRKTEAAVGQEFSSYPSFPLPPPDTTSRRALYLPLFLKLSALFTPRPGGWVGDSPPPTPPTPRTGVSVVRGERKRVGLLSPSPFRPAKKTLSVEGNERVVRTDYLSLSISIAVLHFAVTFRRRRVDEARVNRLPWTVGSFCAGFVLENLPLDCRENSLGLVAIFP